MGDGRERGTGRARYDGPAMGRLTGAMRPGRTNPAGSQKKGRVDSSGSSALEPRMEPSGGTSAQHVCCEERCVGPWRESAGGGPSPGSPSLGGGGGWGHVHQCSLAPPVAPWWQHGSSHQGSLAAFSSRLRDATSRATSRPTQLLLQHVNLSVAAAGAGKAHLSNAERSSGRVGAADVPALVVVAQALFATKCSSPSWPAVARASSAHRVHGASWSSLRA